MNADARMTGRLEAAERYICEAGQKTASQLAFLFRILSGPYGNPYFFRKVDIVLTERDDSQDWG